MSATTGFQEATTDVAEMMRLAEKIVDAFEVHECMGMSLRSRSQRQLRRRRSRDIRTSSLTFVPVFAKLPMINVVQALDIFQASFTQPTFLHPGFPPPGTPERPSTRSRAQDFTKLNRFTHHSFSCSRSRALELAMLYKTKPPERSCSEVKAGYIIL